MVWDMQSQGQRCAEVGVVKGRRDGWPGGGVLYGVGRRVGCHVEKFWVSVVPDIHYGMLIIACNS